MTKPIRILSLITLLGSLVGYIFCVRIMMFHDERGDSCPSEMLFCLQKLATFLLILSILSLLIAYYHWILRSNVADFFKNISLSLVVFLCLLLGSECIFLHHIEPNAIGERWSYKLWDKKFITNRFSFYYKDSKGIERRADLREPIFPLPLQKELVWFIGDSFTFGFGLENTNQTIPSLVGNQLGGKYQSINLGEGGADTYKESETLIAFENLAPKPKAIVWQYFGNDIDSLDEGPDLHEKQNLKNSIILFGQTFFKGKSFLLDYLYWEFFTKNEQDNIQTYKKFLNTLYNVENQQNVASSTLQSSSKYQKHLKPILQSALKYQERKIPFVVVIFPFLWEGGPENSEILYTKRLSSDLIKAKIEVIDLTPLAKKINTSQRIVSLNDPHPSPLMAKIAADTIYKRLNAEF